MIQIPIRAPIDYVWSRDRSLKAWRRDNPSLFEVAWSKYLEDFSWDALRTTGAIVDVPATFRLRRLPRIVITTIDGFAKGLAQDVEVVAFGLLNVSGVTDESGRPLAVRHENAGNLGPRVADEVLDALYDVELFGELARVILRIGRLDP